MKFFSDFLQKYQRHLPAAALLAGLIWDSITLGRPDRLFDNAVLLFYLFVAGTFIVLMSRREHRGKERSFWFLLITQFSFGNLASGLLILYNVSATVSGNWIFLLLLSGFLIGNEVFQNRYDRLRFNTTVFYLLLLAYLALAIPVLLRSIDTWVFFVSGLTSLVVIGLFLFLLRYSAPLTFEVNKTALIRGILGVLVFFNVFYFFNLIPPVPLAAREVGIFHGVERLSSDTVSGHLYRVSYEKGKWYQFWKKSDTLMRMGTPGEAYCFSAVFAPSRLSTSLFHHWERYSETSKEWESVGRTGFLIMGGRDEGYRWYSTKTVAPGKWRCSVETARGSLLGRAQVTIEPGEPTEFVVDTR